MKYEFEIRGEFEAVTPEGAQQVMQQVIDEVEMVMQWYPPHGKVTGHQLAIKGKLQEKSISTLAEDYDAAINAFMNEYERINKS